METLRKAIDFTVVFSVLMIIATVACWPSKIEFKGIGRHGLYTMLIATAVLSILALGLGYLILG